MVVKKVAVLLVLAVASAGSLAQRPASAQLTNACTGAAIWTTSANETRSCTAIAPLYKYVAATLNPWTITVKRNLTIHQTIRSDSVKNAAGTLSTTKGDVITLTTNSMCSAYACANGGVFYIADANP